MIVIRRTHKVKEGCMQEAIALFKEFREEYGGRIYTAHFGPVFGTIVSEIEFESLAEFEKVTAEWFARPRASVWMEEWQAAAGGGVNEIWNLVE